MSTERLNRNFQKFLQSIYHWPSETIEKSALIKKLEELCRENPEIEHIYENVPISKRTDTMTSSMNQSNGTTASEEQTIRRDSNPLVNIKVVKEGELKVRKGSTILSSLIKKNGLKSSVYAELAYELFDSEKLIYLVVYQSRKTRKMIYKFLVDDTCSLNCETKRDFTFQHNSVCEKFTTETGTADAWMAALYNVTMQSSKVTDNQNDEDIYENPDEITSTLSSSFEVVQSMPARPPPRPILPTNSISPEKIFVCLYDHHPTSSDPRELEFKCGDLLYIVNTDGPNFYVGHRLTLPFNEHNQPSKGLVYREFIANAYEKLL